MPSVPGIVCPCSPGNLVIGASLGKGIHFLNHGMVPKSPRPFPSSSSLREDVEFLDDFVACATRVFFTQTIPRLPRVPVQEKKSVLWYFKYSCGRLHAFLVSEN